MTSIATWVGTLACVCMILGYMPQAFATMRSRNTEGISFAAWTFMCLGSLSFVAQGTLTGNTPLVITNAVTGVCSIIILCIKISNERRKKRERKEKSK